MILETAQLLSILINENDNRLSLFLNDMPKPAKTWANHTSTKWLRESRQNIIWTIKLGNCLCKEYTHRYQKFHKYDHLFHYLTNNAHMLMHYYPDIPMTRFKLAAGDYFNICNLSEQEDPTGVLSYRKYYCVAKSTDSLARWKNRNVPEWFVFPSEGENNG
jgi:hypothetical protein